MIRKFLASGFVLVLMSGLLSGCSADRTLGSFFKPVDGPLFRAVPDAPDNRAFLIVYRPYSEWADAELEAPSVYVNGEVVLNIRSNGYALFNLDPGHYQMVIKRPAFGQDLFFMEGSLLEDQPVNFNKIGGFDLNAAAGKTYYLRYSELTSPPYDPETDKSLSGDGPLQFITWNAAKTELAQSRLIQPLKLLGDLELDVALEDSKTDSEESSWWLF